jgi:hypothetical protein
MLSLPHSNAKFSVSFPFTRTVPRSRYLSSAVRYGNEDDHTRTKEIMPTKMTIGTHTYTDRYRPVDTHIHAHSHTHTHTQTGETYESKPLPSQAPRISTRLIYPPASPSRNNSPYQPQPAQPSSTNHPTHTNAIPSRSKYRPSFLSRTPPLAYVSPSHPCTAEPIHSLSLTPFH